jgi:Mg2+-importing ATPase
VIANFAQLGEMVRLARQVSPGWILLSLLCEAATYTMVALNFQQILNALGHKLKLWPLHKIYVALTFVYHVLPFSGFAGAVYLTQRFEKYGVPRGKGLSASILSTFTGYIAFIILLLISAIYLLTYGSQQAIPYGQILAVVAFVLLLFFGIDRLVVHRGWVHARVDNFLKKKPRPEKIQHWGKDLETYFDELAFARDTFKQDWKLFILPTLEQFAVFALDALSLYGLFRGLHEPIGLLPALLAVGLARFFSTISFLPGGVGSYEVAQVVALHAFGVSIPAATLATLVFRFFTYWLPIPFGLLCYRQLRGQKTT